MLDFTLLFASSLGLLARAIQAGRLLEDHITLRVGLITSSLPKKCPAMHQAIAGLRVCGLPHCWSCKDGFTPSRRISQYSCSLSDVPSASGSQAQRSCLRTDRRGCTVMILLRFCAGSAPSTWPGFRGPVVFSRFGGGESTDVLIGNVGAL